MKFWIKASLFAFAILLGIFPVNLPAQAPAEPQGILPLAIKVQAYSPLSNLALPFVRRRENLPFTPRFFVVEVEKYFRGGHGVQVSLGGRRYKERRPIPYYAYDTASGIRGRVSYQKYFQHEEKPAFVGWHLTTGISWISGSRTGRDWYGQYGGAATKAVSLDAGLGWGFTFKQRILVQFSAGPSIGYQNENTVTGRSGDQISNFDYFGWRFGEQSGGGRNTFWGLSANLSWSVGWVLGN